MYDSQTGQQVGGGSYNDMNGPSGHRRGFSSKVNSAIWNHGEARRHPSREFTSTARRVIVKVGTAVLTSDQGYQHHISLGRLGVLVEQLARLVNNGQQPILVTSGAVGIGRQRLKNHQLISRPINALRNLDNSIDEKAAASAGQAVLMSLYDTLFQQLDCMSSQLLLTDDDFKTKEFRSTLRKTVDDLLEMNVIPIFNENDAIYNLPYTDAKSRDFWDNDSLAALLAKELDAELLILMTDVDGVYTGPPREPSSELIHTYCPELHAEMITFGSKSSVGRGGMMAKVDAAWDAALYGCPVIICSGKGHNVLERVMQGELVGTLFSKIEARIAMEEHKQLMKRGGNAREMALSARQASRALQALPTEGRNAALLRVADALEKNAEKILEANKVDVEEATGMIDDQMLQRLILKPGKIKQLAAGIRALSEMKEPISQVLKRRELAEGLVLEQVTSPIGVMLVIFEARPDALPQIASLAIRSGNGLLLKGGKEAARSNAALLEVIHEALKPDVSPELIHIIETREGVSDLLKLEDVVDLVIPRGSNALVQHVQQNTKIPVLGHADGVCHVYVDQDADMDMACKIVVDAKIDYPAACNAMETLLVHEKLVSGGQIYSLMDSLKNASVTLYGGSRASSELALPPAPSKHHEYGDLCATVEIVRNMGEAIDYIHENGSSHTEGIITDNNDAATQFLQKVDSACVFHNASNRFADGFRFGLGAEVGVSTSRIHARGPVGVEGLMTTRWLLRGEGHTVQKDSKIKYTHKELPLDA